MVRGPTSIYTIGVWCYLFFARPRSLTRGAGSGVATSLVRDTGELHMLPRKVIIDYT